MDARRHDALGEVVRLLLCPAPVRLPDRTLHRPGHAVGVHDHPTLGVARRPPDGLDQRRLGPQVAFLVGVEDCHEAHLWQVEALAEEVDTDDDVVDADPQVAQDLDTFEGLDLGVQVVDLHAHLGHVLGELFGVALGEGGDKAPLPGRDALADLPKQVVDLTVDRAYLNDGVEQAGGADELFDDLLDAFVQDVTKTRYEQWSEVLDTNLAGAFRCCRAVARPMMKARSGRIINVSSVVALMGNAGQANYCASKAGLLGLTRSLARELASRGVTVNAVAPGFVETAMTAALTDAQKAKLNDQIPLGRIGQPGDVAGAVVYLASKEAGYVTGQTLHVNGGMYMS